MCVTLGQLTSVLLDDKMMFYVDLIHENYEKNEKGRVASLGYL